MRKRISLNGDWRFKGFVGDDWVRRDVVAPNTRDPRWWRTGEVPGSVANDLLQNKVIPNPYFEENSLMIEWIPDRTWAYRKGFFVADDLKGKRVRLCFKGVDYEAEFYLNGELIGKHVGMYTPVVFDVTDKLKYGEENLVAVIISPAPMEEPQVGKTCKVRTHKSRMTYWWDFCPRMIHLGIWDEVYLEVTDDIRTEEVFIRPQLTEDNQKAYVSVTGKLSSRIKTIADVEVTVLYNGETVTSATSTEVVTGGTMPFSLSLEIDKPHLWWPNGYGAPNLYTAVIKVVDTEYDKALDLQEITFGIRRVEMLKNETKDPKARGYTISVNGRSMYIKGWNWVPIDVMYGVERPDKLKNLITLAKRANVNLLRVWGGGLIEKDAFYELCNQHGIMVWQEFIQSSSGIDNSPATDEAFVEMMKKEARQIVPLKRNHPSLVLWGGGNELMDENGVPLDESHPVLGALEKVVRELDPDRLWLPTSPNGRVSGNNLKNIEQDPLGLHDVHGPWEHQGLTDHYTLYNSGTSLLHSEFGVEGMTNIETLNASIAKENQWPATRDNPNYYHTGAWWVNEELVQKCFDGINDIETLVKASQFLQMEGLRYAAEANRRRKYQNSGTIPWQFNEPFPNGFCTSSVDYYGRPKAVYYGVAHAYEPIHVSARFISQAWADFDKFSAEIWANNSQTQSLNAELSVRIVGASGKVYLEEDRQISCSANKSSRLTGIELAKSEIKEELFFLDLRLKGEKGYLSSNRYLLSTTKDLAPMLSFSETSIDVSKEATDSGLKISVKNTGKSAALLVRFSNLRDVKAPGYVYFSKNNLHLLPGEAETLTVDWTGIDKDEVRVDVQGWNTNHVVL